MPAEFRRQTLGPRGVGGGALSISSTSGERQTFAISATFASGGVAAALISAMISSTLDSATARPFQDVAALARLAQLEARAAHDDLAPVLQEVFEELLEIEQARLVVDQRDHVHPEAVLQLRELVAGC